MSASPHILIKKLRRSKYRVNIVKQDARDNVWDVLRTAKDITVPKTPLPHDAHTNWKPVSVQGKPVSEIVMMHRD